MLLQLVVDLGIAKVDVAEEFFAQLYQLLAFRVILELLFAQLTLLVFHSLSKHDLFVSLVALPESLLILFASANLLVKHSRVPAGTTSRILVLAELGVGARIILRVVLVFLIVHFIVLV